MKFRLVFLDNSWGNADVTAVTPLATHNMADARAALARAASDWATELLKKPLSSVEFHPLPFPQYVAGFTVEYSFVGDEFIHSYAVVLELAREKSDA
jgi:hypothetical protein